MSDSSSESAAVTHSGARRSGARCKLAMIHATLLPPAVVVVSVAVVVVPSVALSVAVVVVVVVSVSVVVSGIPNYCCAKAKKGYCCPGIALDAKSPVAAIENIVAATRSMANRMLAAKVFWYAIII